MIGFYFLVLDISVSVSFQVERDDVRGAHHRQTHAGGERRRQRGFPSAGESLYTPVRAQPAFLFTDGVRKLGPQKSQISQASKAFFFFFRKPSRRLKLRLAAGNQSSQTEATGRDMQKAASQILVFVKTHSAEFELFHTSSFVLNLRVECEEMAE